MYVTMTFNLKMIKTLNQTLKSHLSDNYSNSVVHFPKIVYASTMLALL